LVIVKLLAVLAIMLPFGLGAIALLDAHDPGKAPEIAVGSDTSFSSPVSIAIEGYSGHAMEPFLTRDGRFLFFNNRNDPKDQTDLHVARRVSDLRFTYLGPMAGANSSALDGVASADVQGRFYFVSTREYDAKGNTLWAGRLEKTRLINAHPLRTDFTPKELLRLNIDMEISADGDTLYVAENRWDLLRSVPATSDIAMASRNGEVFERLPQSDRLMQNINSNVLEFAPATSTDQLTFYFTRLDMKRLRKKQRDAFMVMVSTRPDRASAWGVPKRIAAISGHVEAPTVATDGCSLYFHRNDAGMFGIYFTRRIGCDT
jgi:hypothetical protein